VDGSGATRPAKRRGGAGGSAGRKWKGWAKVGGRSKLAKAVNQSQYAEPVFEPTGAVEHGGAAQGVSREGGKAKQA